MSVEGGVGRRLIMNFIVVLVTFGSTAFLFRFLMALAKEQKKTPRLLRAHWLDHSVVGKNNPGQSERVSLRIVSPQEFHVLSISQTKITQKQNLG